MKDLDSHKEVHMTYTTIQGQTWDQIAKEVYGSEQQAGALMAANPRQLDTFIFSAGEKLNVPKVEEAAVNLPPWRK